VGAQVIDVPPPPVDIPVPPVPEEAEPVTDAVAPEATMVCNSVAVVLVDFDLLTQLVLPVVLLEATGSPPPRIEGTSPWFGGIRRPCAAVPLPDRSSACSPDDAITTSKDQAFAADPTGAGGATAILGLPDVRAGGVVDGVASKESVFEGATGQQLPARPSGDVAQLLECRDEFAPFGTVQPRPPLPAPSVHALQPPASPEVAADTPSGTGGNIDGSDRAVLGAELAEGRSARPGHVAAVAAPAGAQLGSGAGGGASPLLRGGILAAALALLVAEGVVQARRQRSAERGSVS
jgi:hypothetical protein